MKVDIALGRTKAASGIFVFPTVLGEPKGERVVLLLQSEGKPEGNDNLKEEFLSVLNHVVLDAEGEAYARLENALKELNGLLKGFVLSDAVRDVHAIVGVLEQDGNLHVSHVGRAEAYLIRDGSAAQITEYARGKQPLAFMHIVSGPLEARDHVIMSTHRLLRTITPAQLVQMAHRGGDVLHEIVGELEGEKEAAALTHFTVHAGKGMDAMVAETVESGKKGDRLRDVIWNRAAARRKNSSGAMAVISSLLAKLPAPRKMLSKLPQKGKIGQKLSGVKTVMDKKISRFNSDLKDPARKRRAHLLLLAGAAGLFLIIWMLVQLSLSSQRSQTRDELSSLVNQINADLSMAENRHLTGDTDSANAILKRAEDRARQVMVNESGLFRSEALDLLGKIRSKKEEINKVVRIPPRVMANLSAKKPGVTAQGMIGFDNGEFLVFDKQQLYRVSLNSVEESDQLSGEELIIDGASFSRYQSRVFLTTGNGVTEIINGQLTTMKTEDPAGWVTGTDIETYLRFLYVLSPERKQIYKYERLSSRYGPPAEYNVSGEGTLAGALDMAVSGAIYVLRENAASADKPAGREVVKLLRGEKQSFSIRNLPPDALDGVTKIFKSSENGNFYFLDPVGKRVVVTTNDGDLGDSLYLKQFALESDEVGTLVDLYVDVEDTRLYVLDEKRLYVIDLQGR